MRKFLTIAGAGVLAATLLASPALASTNSGNIDPKAIGSITLHKFAGSPWVNGEQPEDAVPVADVQFTGCLIEGLDITTSEGQQELNDLNGYIALPTNEGKLPEGVKCSPIGSERTNADGMAYFSNLKVAAYYFTESDAPDRVAEHTWPFIATVPISHEGQWAYDVNIYPKNAVVDVDKSTDDIGSVGVGAAIPWFIDTAVPFTQREITYYALGDDLDPRLTYIEGSSQLLLGEDVFPEDFYNFSNDKQLLKIELNELGLEEINGRMLNEDTTSEDMTFHWEFYTKINSIGDGIVKNEALVWVNNPTSDIKVSPGITTNWGAVKFIKFDDKSDDRLEGASFQVFATKELADSCLTEVGEKDFDTKKGCNEAIESNGTSIFTTNKDGVSIIEGLRVGTNDEMSRSYWAVEIKAPAGYILGDKAFEIIVKPGSIETIADSAVISVANAKVPETPVKPTGTEGKIVLISVAILFAGAAGVLIARKKA